MNTDDRAQFLCAASVAVCCMSLGAPGQGIATPLAATSNRAYRCPVHGLPTPFTGAIMSFSTDSSKSHKVRCNNTSPLSGRGKCVDSSRLNVSITPITGTWAADDFDTRSTVDGTYDPEPQIHGDAPRTTDGQCVTKGTADRLLVNQSFGYYEALLCTADDGLNAQSTVVFCDPLTGLVAYPSFAEFLTRNLPELASSGLYLAIGDVDDLKEYVCMRRSDDPTCFGHLAGNECMQALGRVTRRWAANAFTGWPFSLCGTFGGDEVIIAAAGRNYTDFQLQLQQLEIEIRQEVPRTCSFSSGSLTDERIGPQDSGIAYRELVAQVDAALFDQKTALRERNISPQGHITDIGHIVLTSSGGGGREIGSEINDQIGNESVSVDAQ